MFPLNEKQLELQARVRTLVETEIRPIAEQIAKADVFSVEAYQILRDAGLLKLVVPKKWGGPEAGILELSLVTSEIARVSGAATLIYFPTQAIISILMQMADRSQLDRWMPDLAKGEKLGAFCLTEPNYGSDAGSLRGRAERVGDEYILNGTKSYVTLGEHAHYYVVFMRTGPGKRTAGISAFVVRRDAPGLSFGKIERKMGLSGSVTQEMILQDCRVPVEDRLLEEGQGWRVLTEAANPMRMWGAGSMSLGMAQGAYELALEHVRSREASGHRIGRFQSIQFTLADMASKIEAVRSMIWLTAARLDRGELTRDEAEKYVSMCKYSAADMAMGVCTDAVQVFGREGVVRGNTVERLFRDAKAVQIFDGSNQVQRMIVARHILF